MAINGAGGPLPAEDVSTVTGRAELFCEKEQEMCWRICFHWQGDCTNKWRLGT